MVTFSESSYLLEINTKNPPVMQETQVQSLGKGDPLENGSSNPLQYSCLENCNPWDHKRVRHD